MAAETFRISIPIEVKDKTDPGVTSATHKVNGFDKANQKTQERLNQMNKTKYQVVLAAMDRASGIIGNVTSKARSLAGRTFSFTMKAIDFATRPLRSLLNFATSIQGVITGIMTGIAVKKLIIEPIGLADSLTNANVGFETMLGSAKAAKKMMSDIQNFAIKTPFNTSDVIQNTQTMMAYGFQAKDVIKDMEIIGNQAAATGRGAEGLQSIALALGQMQAHGKVAAQDMNQLTSVGVKGWDYLAQALGKSKAEVMALSEAGKISSDVAIPALLKGMQEFDGMMDKTANGTAKGLLSQIKDTFDIKIFTRFGQGLQRGVIGGLSKFNDWIGNNQDIIAEWGDKLEEVGSIISKYVVSKVEDLQTTIRKMTNSQEWKVAQTFGAKMKVAWDKIIAEPFSSWWNSTGKAWLADKASKMGEGIGTALSAGLLALLGVDLSGAAKDGTSIGASFATGFSKGFDGKKVGETILTAIKGVFKDAGTLLPGGKEASSTSWLSAGAIALALSKLGVFKLLGKGGKGIASLFGKGSNAAVPSAAGMPSAYSTTTMTVTASVVNVYGTSVNNVGQAAKSIISTAGGSAGGAAIGTAGAAAGRALLTGGSQLALPAAAGMTGAAAGASSLKALWLAQAPGGAAGAALANTGVALGSGASTAGGAAVAGASGILGGVLGLLGIGAGAIDIYQGTQKTGKGSKDEYVQGGTKLGMVAAGAGTGALIGSVVPGIGTAIGALVGAGVGGAGALFGGDKAGKALSDSTDKGGGMTTFWENTKKTASNTWESVKSGASNAGAWVSDKWNEAGDWISTKWDGFSDWFDTSVWTPAKDIGISAINIAAGAWSEGKDWIGDKWSDFSGWFDTSVWTPVSDAAQAAGNWVGEKWGETKASISDKWSDFSTWFDESVWTPVSSAAQTAGQWISDRWSEARTWVDDCWSDFSGWFEESIWTPVKTGAQAAGTWIGYQFTAAKGAVQEAWTGVSGWFSENVWEPIKNGATSAWNWVGDKLGGIGDWMGDKWTSFKDWLGGLGQKGSKETGLTTSEGKGTVLEHAYGGIMTQPHMGIVAEAGAESIIPLSPSRRTRGIDLWRETGELLGIRPYADGGVIGRIEATGNDMPIASGAGNGGVTIKVEVKAEPKFTIEGGDTSDGKIIEVLKGYIRSMADDIGDELAERLARIFANMPVKA